MWAKSSGGAGVVSWGRALAAVLAGALLAGAAAAPTGGAAPIDDARAKVAEAQQAADAAAGRYEEAIGRLEQLGADIEDRKARIAAGKQEAAELSVLAERRAVTAYIGRDTLTDGSFLIEGGDPLDEVRRQKLLARTKEEEDDAVDRLVELNQDLAHEQRQLELQRTEQERAVKQVEEEQAVVQTQLQEAQQAVDLLEEQLRREEEAARARELAAAAARDASNRDNGNDYTGAYVSTGIVCPVQGAVSFIDSWGAPRHQGAHQGVDMMAATGTPNVAIVSGDVTFKEGGTSGLGAYLHGDDGNLYYYFHLSAYEGGARHVSQGEVIGYVGNTGDARYTAPHTHFEIHPGGGAAVNPYPSVAAVC
jgi:peptidoglycan LD-endopeptidase LytH